MTFPEWCEQENARARRARWWVSVAVVWGALWISCGCAPLCLRSASTLTVTGTPPPGADAVLAAAWAARPCTPRAWLRDLPLAGRIAWRTEPWTVDGRLVAGVSQSESCDLEVEVLAYPHAAQSALAHEVGHWLWSWCHGRSGEGEEAFVRWYRAVNASVGGGK